jgi:ribosome-associated protein
LRGISTFTDFFVVCSGTSEPHLKAIATEVREQLREKHGEKPTFADGIPASHWVVLDYSDVMLHIFTAEKRAFYALDRGDPAAHQRVVWISEGAPHGFLSVIARDALGGPWRTPA